MSAAFLGRVLFLGGGFLGNTIGGALAGIGNAAGGIAQGAGSAVGGIAQGIGSAVGGAITPAPNVVINNVGMIGNAAKGKVTGGGTLPAPKKAAKPTVNVNMPTEKLLVVAVNYLSSIDKTLQNQLKFESQAFAQQVQADRENAIEDKSPGIFTKMSDKLGGLLKTEDSSTMKSRAGNLTKIILGATGLAGLGLLAIGTMDTSELDRLKNSWAQFNDKFSWLTDMAAAIASPAAGLGYLIGGWRGAVLGAVVDWMTERLTGSSTGDLLLGALGLGGAQAGNDATAAGQPNTGFDYAMGGVVAGYGAYRGVKTYRDVRARMTTMAQQRAAPRAAPALRGSGFRDPRTGRVVSRAAATAGGGWLSGPKGLRFVAFLSRRFGASYIARKIVPLLAKVFAGIAIAATGIGAIPGALWTLVNIGLAIATVVDLVNAYWDWSEEEESRADAEVANAATPQPDAESTSRSLATPALAANRIVARSETGLPEEAQAFFESKGWTKEQAAGIVGNLVVESGLRTDAEGDGGRAYGIAQWHPDRQQNFRNFAGKDIRQSTFQEQLEFVNWELNNTEISAGNRLRGASSAEDAAAIVDQYYERSAGIHRQERIANASSIMQGDYANLSGGGGSGQSSLASSIINLTKGAIEAIAGIAAAGFGPMNTRDITSSLVSNAPSQIGAAGAAVGADSIAAPAPTAPDNRAAEVSAASTRIQTTMEMGAPKSKETTLSAETAGQSSLRNASSDSKLEIIDPNYPGIMAGLDGYLQYYRLAA